MSQPGRGEKLGLAGVAAAALAVVCCAAGPLLLAWVGSVAVGRARRHRRGRGCAGLGSDGAIPAPPIRHR